MTRNWAGTMSNRSETSSPMQCRQPPQAQVRLSGSITSSMRGKCSGTDPRLAARGLAGRLAARASASSSAWIAAMAVSRSSSASSNWSGSLFSDRRPKAACLKAATSFSSRAIRSSLRRLCGSEAISIAFSVAISLSRSVVSGMAAVYHPPRPTPAKSAAEPNKNRTIPPPPAPLLRWPGPAASPARQTGLRTGRGSSSAARPSPQAR